MRLSLASSDEPALLSGLVAERMSGSAFSALTVSSIGFLYFEAVIVSPLGAVSTTGFVPLAWDGKRSERRSVTAWLPVPGSVTLSLTFVPAVRGARARGAKNAPP